MAIESVPITPGTGQPVGVDMVGSPEIAVQVVKPAFGADGEATMVSSADPLPVDTGLVQGLTDAQMRATPVPVSGTVVVTDGGGSVTVDGPLTDAQLRATAVPITGAVTGPLTDAQLRASAVPMSAASLPLPTGAATEATQAALNVKIPALATRPLDNAEPGVPVRAIGQEIWNVSFAASGASVLAPEFTTPIVGAGITYNQASSALNIVTGTNANAEFLTRSLVAWRGSLRIKFGIVASQRIVNNNLAVMLADLIGENLAYTINSATSVTVAVPGHTFTAQSVGQFIHLGGITGAAGVPGRYAIASVVANTSITFTVAGWPASGSGTLTLFGHSYVRNLFTGGTPTNVNWDAQRRGWATGDTVATINSTASPGTVIHNELAGRECFLLDQLRASVTSPTVTNRAFRTENIPDDNLDLYLFIWNFNGSTAPLSTTTFTIGFVSVEKFANVPVYVQGIRPTGNLGGASSSLPVNVMAGTISAIGPAAHDAAISSNPVRIAGRAMTANYAAVQTGDTADLVTTLVGALVQKPFTIPQAEFAANLSLTTTTAAPIAAAAAAGIRNHITSFWAINTGAATVDLIILDGATERARYPLPVNVPVAVQFPTGLLTTAATALNANLSAAGTVRVVATGYTAP
ncbi:hypothetical protein [Microcystis phage Mae-JY24]